VEGKRSTIGWQVSEKTDRTYRIYS